MTLRLCTLQRRMRLTALMDRKGTPIGEQAFADKPCFLLTDHIPMPKKVIPGLERMGAKKISLGPTMLFASQCVVLIHYALDQGPRQAMVER